MTKPVLVLTVLTQTGLTEIVTKATAKTKVKGKTKTNTKTALVLSHNRYCSNHTFLNKSI